MKQIIIEPEWLGILENQSPEFLARVTSAIFDFFLHDTQPSGLSQAEQVAYDFLLNNILRYQQQYDLDAGYEAVIKRKRAAEARAKKASLKSAGKHKTEAHPKLIVPVEGKENYKTVPPVTDAELRGCLITKVKLGFAYLRWILACRFRSIAGYVTESKDEIHPKMRNPGNINNPEIMNHYFTY